MSSPTTSALGHDVSVDKGLRFLEKAKERLLREVREAAASGALEEMLPGARSLWDDTHEEELVSADALRGLLLSLPRTTMLARAPDEALTPKPENGR